MDIVLDIEQSGDSELFTIFKELTNTWFNHRSAFPCSLVDSKSVANKWNAEVTKEQIGIGTDRCGIWNIDFDRLLG